MDEHAALMKVGGSIPVICNITGDISAFATGDLRPTIPAGATSAICNIYIAIYQPVLKSR